MTTSPEDPQPGRGAAAERGLLHDRDWRAAFAASLRPVFLVAGVIALVAFVLTWWLPELPLRTATPAQAARDSFGSPGSASAVTSAKT